MAGPTIGIELPDPVTDSSLAQLTDLIVRVSVRLTQPRRGYYDTGIDPGALGMTPANGTKSQPFVVAVNGPGFGDEALEADWVDDAELVRLIGFRPTHEVSVLAMSNRDIDHKLTALLTAAVMEIVGGIAEVEVERNQVAAVRELPGFISLANGIHAVAYGSEEFVRAWVEHPDFRLVK